LHIKAIQSGDYGICVGRLAEIGEGKTPERAGLI
jgi:hypothetical protein